MCADFKGVRNAADHRGMFKHMRQLGMPPTLSTNASTSMVYPSYDYITPYCFTPSIDINHGTLHGDTLSPFLITLFFEPFLGWLTVGSRGYHPGAPSTYVDPVEPTPTYIGHGFANDLSLATGCPTNMTIQLMKLSLLIAYTGMIVNVQKCCITGAL
jgi:hypothetical protein